jgi:hypothetical protein
MWLEREVYISSLCMMIMVMVVLCLLDVFFTSVKLILLLIICILLFVDKNSDVFHAWSLKCE